MSDNLKLDIDFDPDWSRLDATSAPQTVLSENPASFSPHNLEKAATAVRQEPDVIGFGVADL